MSITRTLIDPDKVSFHSVDMDVYGEIRSIDSGAAIFLEDTNGLTSTNAGKWKLYSFQDELILSAFSDNELAQDVALKVTRTGLGVDEFQFQANITSTGNVEGFNVKASDSVTINSGAPALILSETGRATDEGKWEFSTDAGTFFIGALNDAETIPFCAIEIFRGTGVVVDSVRLCVSTNVDGNLLVTTGNVTIETAAPTIRLNETGRATDEGNWEIVAQNDNFQINTRDDALSTEVNVISLVRGTGTAVDHIELNAPTNVSDLTSDSITLTPTASTPSSPVNGMLAISDGTASGFDGSSGAGLYRYNGSSWTFIG